MWKGVNWKEKPAKSFRIASLNVDRFSHDVTKSNKQYNLIDKINELKCDIMYISGHGLNLSKFLGTTNFLNVLVDIGKMSGTNSRGMFTMLAEPNLSLVVQV